MNHLDLKIRSNTGFILRMPAMFLSFHWIYRRAGVVAGIVDSYRATWACYKAHRGLLKAAKKW